VDCAVRGIALKRIDLGRHVTPLPRALSQCKRQDGIHHAIGPLVIPLGSGRQLRCAQHG
jgi:hypothetical protein